MTQRRIRCIVIDAREFVYGRFTGIGRFLEGLIDALDECSVAEELILGVYDPDLIPSRLRNRPRIKTKKIPQTFLKSEKALTDLSKQKFGLFISPYPKLPLFGCHCIAVHTIHDVLDLTHPAYRKRSKASFDSFRLKSALRKANLTWYVSSWSLEETTRYVGYTGKNPKVRHNGIDETFAPKREKNEEKTLKKYQIEPGYILVVGNGFPHKNLGAILEIGAQLRRRIVFVGVSRKNQAHWKSRYQEAKGIWISHVIEEDLPAMIRGAFCLVQPSTAEGYGYPPLEAMACGVPAIVSDISVLAETTGGNAMIAHSDDPREWREAIESLENENFYQSQVEKGLKWVKPLRGRKGWQKHISDIKELLEKP